MVVAADIGVALRSARKAKSLSVRVASASIGVSAATLKRWECGKCLPRASTLNGILDQWGLENDAPSRAVIGNGFATRARAWSVESTQERPVLRLLRSRRRRNHLTLDEIERVTGVAKASLHRYETGERTPDPESLRSVAQATGCSSAEIEVLKRSLYAVDREGVDDIDIPMRFLHRGSESHALIFDRADTLFRNSDQMTDPSLDYIWQVCYGLMIMADYDSLVELWPYIKGIPFLRGSSQWSQIFAASKILASVHLNGKSPESEAAYRRYMAGVNSIEDFETHMTAGMLAVRLAVALGDYSGGLVQLAEQEQRANLESWDRMEAIFAVYRSMFDLYAGNPLGVVRDTEAMRKKQSGILQSYTIDVLETMAQHRLANSARVAELLTHCSIAEQTYGLGSPTLNRIRRSSRIAS